MPFEAPVTMATLPASFLVMLLLIGWFFLFATKRHRASGFFALFWQDNMEKHISTSADSAKAAFRFVLIVGVINLFADMTYEGGRGIAGPFLGSLGASATVVGFIAGFGELVGYGLRSLTGYVADKT